MHCSRSWVLAVGSQLLSAHIAIAQTPHVIEAPNFLGKNVCMKIERPAVASLSADQLPFPVIQMETELGHREADYPRYAKYSIRVGNLGTISVDEALAADGACVNLPPDFVWHDDNGSKRSTARFCLPGADGRRNVLVQASAQADTGTLASVKSALVGIAACRMTLYPSQYDSRDVFSNGERLLVGPYWLGR